MIPVTIILMIKVQERHMSFSETIEITVSYLLNCTISKHFPQFWHKMNYKMFQMNFYVAFRYKNLADEHDMFQWKFKNCITWQIYVEYLVDGGSAMIWCNQSLSSQSSVLSAAYRDEIIVRKWNRTSCYQILNR